MAQEDLVEVQRKVGEGISMIDERLRRIKRTAMTTAAAGVVHAVVLLFAFWLLKSRTPGIGASQAEVQTYYQDPSHRRIVLLAGIYLIPFAGIAFIWFTVGLRAWVGQIAADNDVIRSNILLVCGVIYITLIFSAGASMSVISTSMELGGQSSDPNLARNFLLYGTSLFLVFAVRMASMVVSTMTSIGRTTGILPIWLQVIGAMVSLVMLLVSSFNSWFVVVFPLWLVVFSVFLFKHAREIPADSGFNLPRLLDGIRTQARRFMRRPAERSRAD